MAGGEKNSARLAVLIVVALGLLGGVVLGMKIEAAERARATAEAQQTDAPLPARRPGQPTRPGAGGGR